MSQFGEGAASVLDVRELSVSFGPVDVLSDVSLRVAPQQIVGLIGPNGAGKTTLVDAITGFVPSRGRIALNGESIGRLPAQKRSRRGIARTWQSADLFEDLTVRENLAVVHRRRVALWSRLWSRQSDGPEPAAIDEMLDRFNLSPFADRLPGSLSEGQRKLVGVSRALVAEPSLLLLDEPAAGLNSEESAALGAHIRSMATSTTSVLLIDHDMGLVLSTCDHLVVLDFGRVIAEGAPDVVRRDPAVITAYLGTGGVSDAS